MTLIEVLSYEEGLEELVRYSSNRSLVPIFGAGFTTGCESYLGTVPNTSTATKDMISLIQKSNSCPCSADEMSSMDFFSVSDIFFDCVEYNKRADYFEKKYTNVKLFQPQIDFLTKIPWPYAYTLNIDDGIEENSDFSVVLPYHKFRRPKTSKKLLYKLHGDAAHECKYNDENQENIIFSQRQYLRAITEENNSDIYDALLSDYSQQNIVFIGCKLSNEIDLKYIYDKSKEYESDSKRIVLRRNMPSVNEQLELKRHGINQIILVDSVYDTFYSDFINKYMETLSKKITEIYKFFNPQIKPVTDKENSIKLISGINIFDEDNNLFKKGALHIRRIIVNTIIEELEKNSCVLLKGRRFSGKTFVLCSLIEHFKSKDIFFFPSTYFSDEEVIERVFSNQKNSVFIFDSNSLTPEAYGLILKYSEDLKSYNNYLIITTNSNDNNIVSRLKCNTIQLYNDFFGCELEISSKALDSYGLTRRKERQTNIDFLYILKNEQNIDIPFSIAPINDLSSVEKSVLIALCALDKMYFSDIIALRMPFSTLKKLCEIYNPIIELVTTSEYESTRHSKYKLVHNSKIALLDVLKNIPDEDIPTCIYYIVKCYKNDHSRRRLYIDIILFDTLSQIFSDRSTSKQIIHNVYVSLQSILNNDLHYWLQRAKSIYRTPNAIESLEDAYTYSKKAYLDGDEKLSIKAALTSSLISCAIAETKNDDKIVYYSDSVNLAYEAVFSDIFTLYPSYLDSELLIGKNTTSERRITNACKYVISNSDDDDIVSKAKNILLRFETLKANKTEKQ